MKGILGERTSKFKACRFGMEGVAGSTLKGQAKASTAEIQQL